MGIFGLAPLILIFPIIGVLFNGLVGRRFVEYNRETGEKWSGWFAVVMALAAFAIAVTMLFALQANEFRAEVVVLFDWIRVGDFYVPWAMQIDTLSVTMMLVVTGVGSLIHIYAIGYMHGDPNFSRFFNYLNLFLFFMLILVTGNNYLMLFVGWEGVGLCSFLLIGFWFDRVNEKGEAMNANAARKAFVANRVGDLAMILAMILTFWTFKSLEFQPVFDSAIEMFESGQLVQFGTFEATLGGVLTAVTVLFLVGAAGKSAQIPLYVWLPDAMAGPTPVSALIHAATMVTSGIYLIVRSNVLFEIVRESGEVISFLGISSPDLVAYTGAATALFAGLIAFTQNDIKKVLAYSTVSQLGFMIAAVGMGAYVAGMFHLITHAFFKALLFLGSGSVIHGMEHGHHEISHGNHDEHDSFDPQDMRTMGGLRHKMPWTFRTYMVGALALAGIFPFAGFWSKDEILAHSDANNAIVYWLLTAAAVCTAFYMGRQLKMVFFGESRHKAADHAHESPATMTVPLMILAGLATLGGLLNLPFLSEVISDANDGHAGGIWLALEGWLEHSIAAFELSKEGLLNLPHTPLVLSPMIATVSTALAVAALGLAFYVVYGKRPKTAEERDPLQSTPIWWLAVLPLDTLYMKGVIPLFNRLADFLAHRLDWDFWHNFVHERIIRDTFVGFANFASDVLDRQGVDGLVNGAGQVTRWLAGGLRQSQTGYARTYALGIFLGTVALLTYFLWPFIVG
ncbi:NADH-ubiquinone oxidoreductase chain L [hydrothermal vent metagenome]|uniref:NADH-ubiquinone oxidoreductase chain L n=1 Tax=hydrothermal vent metagenome TaxID=652676 RepID=A0A3B0V5F8_9ZZZZ